MFLFVFICTKTKEKIAFVDLKTFLITGTGKTWTAVGITCHFINNNWQTGSGQILLCAPTNKALDVIASKY